MDWGYNDDKNGLNVCLRKVVRLPFARFYVPVPLTGVDAATGGFGAGPGACGGTTEENRGCAEGTTPRRLDGLCVRTSSVRVHTVEFLGVSDMLCRYLPRQVR